MNQDERLQIFSVKLCEAVKKHAFLYDQPKGLAQNQHPQLDTAWKEVAEECEETAETCRARWKNMRGAYYRAASKGSSKYYLHEHMTFLLPFVFGNDNDETKNDESKTDIEFANTSKSQENEQQKSEENDKNSTVEEEKITEIDSDTTTSADETLNLLTTDNSESQNINGQDIKDEIQEIQTEQVGEFSIQEMNAEGAKNDKIDSIENNLESHKNNMGSVENNLHSNDNMDSSLKKIDSNENIDSLEKERHRSRYTRACKRGLDAEIVNELKSDKQDEKRPRRSGDRRKSLAVIALEEFNKRKSLQSLTNKKMEVKINKNKPNKITISTVKDVEQQPPSNLDTSNYSESQQNMEYPVYNTIMPQPIQENEIFRNILNNTSFSQIIPYQKPEMVDSSTITDLCTSESSTQYEAEDLPLDFDDSFINSLKPQLRLMNGRQKMNFKRKVFQSLMEVFDDASNFPNTNEYIVLPSTGAPRFDTTTNGELRLMRELVSIVQAAKTTPEIILDKEKVIDNSKKDQTPAKVQTTETPQSSSPILISPTLEDEDLRFTSEILNDDDDSLPQSLNEILARHDDDEVLGLPRRVIHKVVKVAGPNGSTIVARDGDKRRVYRIYPKTSTTVDNNRGTPKNMANIGTFFVTPNKTTTPNRSNADNSNHTNKTNTSTPNMTFRTLNRPLNNSSGTIVLSNSTSRTQNNSNNIATPNTSIVNSILHESTGLFTSPSVNSKTPPPTNTNTTKSPMLPPSVSTIHSGNINPSMRSVSVRSHISLSKDNQASVTNQNAIMQRRYSICGPAVSRGSPTPALPKAVQKFRTVRTIPKASIMPSNTTSQSNTSSQIQISKPMSLNAMILLNTQSTNNPRLFTTHTNFSNAANSTTTTNSPRTTSSITTHTTSINKNANTTNTSTTSSNANQSKSVFEVSYKTNKNASVNITNVTDNRTTTPPQKSQDIPVVQTAGTIAADIFSDPLFVNNTVKSEPIDD